MFSVSIGFSHVGRVSGNVQRPSRQTWGGEGAYSSKAPETLASGTGFFLPPAAILSCGHSQIAVRRLHEKSVRGAR